MTVVDQALADPRAGPGAAADPWADALLAARLLAADAGLGGAVVRGPAGPARDAWLTAYRAALAEDHPVCRMPPGIDDTRLLGGVDLAATLAAGRPVAARGLLAEAAGGTIIVPLAERLDPGLTGRLAAALDADFGTRFVFLDEGEGDEAVPPALAERCGLWVELAMPPAIDSRVRGNDGAAIVASPALPDAAIDTLCATAAAFGVDSARAALFAVRAARGCAALGQRAAIGEADLAAAARLVLGPRATRLPVADPSPSDERDRRDPGTGQDAEPPEVGPEMGPHRRGDDGEDGSGDDRDGNTRGDNHRDDTAPAAPSDPADAALTDRVVAATTATLPPDILAALAAGRAVAGRGGGSGAVRKSTVRGRPLPSRAGSPRGSARLALVDTLRAAAPWQTLRRPSAASPSDPSGASSRGSSSATRVIVRRDDFRLRRFAERAEATMVFAVDASGSAAIARLAEAKGAVELLLAEAYVRRTQVALVAFRGTAAELVLPPTRSLARAKRVLADLAGGGGTPLAAGLDAAGAVASAAAAKGQTPFIVVLTDGRANIARDGTATRERAAADALTAARGIAARRTAAAFIDTSARPRPEGAALAAAMGARYVALPAAGAAAMAGVVRALAPKP